MSKWLTCVGRLEIIRGNVRIRLPDDLISYYKQFVDKQFKLFTGIPAHGAHITVASEKLHKNITKSNLAYARNKFIHTPIKIEYNPDIKVGGYSKEFKNFYMLARSEVLSQLARILEISEPPYGFHITVSNTKQGIVPYVHFTPKNIKDLKSV